MEGKDYETRVRACARACVRRSNHMIDGVLTHLDFEFVLGRRRRFLYAYCRLCCHRRVLVLLMTNAPGHRV